MPDLRRDPYLERWVLVAPERRNRPNKHTFRLSTPAEPDPACPFCPGNEGKTPGETDALRLDGGSGWLARAIPNKYPAIAPGLPEEIGSAHFRAVAAGGRHEVIVDSPDHCKGLADLGDAHAARVLTLLQRRVREFYRTPSVRAIAAYKNHGAFAGMSLDHSHTQLVGLPVVPRALWAERQMAEQALAETGRPHLDQVIERELEDGRRVVEAGEAGAAVWCPFASRFPFQTIISPWPTRERFAETPDAAVAAVGGALARVLRGLKDRLGDPPLNVLFYFEPNMPPEPPCPGWRWRIEVAPRLTGLAGLEIGWGIHINEVAPEEAAERLRGPAG